MFKKHQRIQYNSHTRLNKNYVRKSVNINNIYFTEKYIQKISGQKNYYLPENKENM